MTALDNLVFCCAICVSGTGGYKDFFHCPSCAVDGDMFDVCRSCIEENDECRDEHQNEFPDHELLDPEDSDNPETIKMSNLYIEMLELELEE